MLVRTENIAYSHGQLVFDADPQNETYLVRLDAGLGVAGVEWLDDAGTEFVRHVAHYRGFQDLHPIRVGGRWLAVGNSWELSDSDGQEMAVLELDGATVTRVHRLVGPEPGRREKNWMPFVRDDVLHLVYSCSPTVVLRCDATDGSLTTVAEHEAPPVASYLRGGSQGLPLPDGGFLFVVHETYFAPERRYSHRLLRLSRELAIDALSPPFTFTDEVREFCAGAAIRDGELVLSFGVRHTEAWLAVVPLDAALGLLEPVGR